MVPCGDRSIPGIVGDHDPCSHLYETACLSVDSVRRCGGDRVSVSADLSDGTEWLVLWIGHSVLLVIAVVEAVTFCIRKLPMSFLTGALYLISGVAVLCVGLEILIDRFLGLGIELRWSAIVLTICVIVDITIATLLSRRRLRNAVRRRLHF